MATGLRKTFRLAMTAAAVFAAAQAGAKSGSAHINDMCAVFGTRADNPSTSRIFKCVTEEMDKGRTGRQIYTLNQKIKKIAMNFKWGGYTHRIFFHWGFNGNPRKSAALAERVNAATEDELLREKIWKIIIEEQDRRNKRMIRQAEIVLAGNRAKDPGASGGKLGDLANGIVSIAYDVHIIGDYIEGKDMPMKAIASLDSVKADIVAATRRITKNDPDFSAIGKARLSAFSKAMEKKNWGNMQKRGETVLNIMEEHLPGIFSECGFVSRRLELGTYPSQK